MLKFYKDFGIDLQINQFQNVTEKELFKQTKSNTKKTTNNLYKDNEKNYVTLSLKPKILTN